MAFWHLNSHLCHSEFPGFLLKIGSGGQTLRVWQECDALIAGLRPNLSDMVEQEARKPGDWSLGFKSQET